MSPSSSVCDTADIFTALVFDRPRRRYGLDNRRRIGGLDSFLLRGSDMACVSRRPPKNSDLNLCFFYLFYIRLIEILSHGSISHSLSGRSAFLPYLRWIDLDVIYDFATLEFDK